MGEEWRGYSSTYFKYIYFISHERSLPVGKVDVDNFPAVELGNKLLMCEYPPEGTNWERQSSISPFVLNCHVPKCLLLSKVAHYYDFEVTCGAFNALCYVIFTVWCGFTVGLLRAMPCMISCNERGSPPQNTLHVQKILLVDWEGIQ